MSEFQEYNLLLRIRFVRNMGTYPQLLRIKCVYFLGSILISDINTVVNSLPVLQNNYGFAGKKFIKFVVNLLKTEGEDGEARLKADHAKMMAELKPYDSHKGKLNEVAVIALADYYASLSSLSSPSSLSVFGVANEADKAVDEAADKAIDVNKAINVNEAVAWREAVQLGKWILLSAIDNPVVLK